MTKAKKSSSKATKWYEQLDQDAIGEALDETLVDACGDEEQLLRDFSW